MLRSWQASALACALCALATAGNLAVGQPAAAALTALGAIFTAREATIRSRA